MSVSVTLGPIPGTFAITTYTSSTPAIVPAHKLASTLDRICKAQLHRSLGISDGTGTVPGSDCAPTAHSIESTSPRVRRIPDKGKRKLTMKQVAQKLGW